MTGRPFRFAVQALDFGDPEAVVSLAVTAEALGYDELYTADHVGLPDPFVPLMAAAAVTSRLRLGPLVLNNELHHPALLARTVATLDRFTGGRVVLGLGTGYQRSEHEATAIELREPSARVDRLEESLVVLRSLLGAGAASFAGEHHRIELDDLGVRPVQERVPVLIGGHGRRVVALAARNADIFQFTGLTHGPRGQLGPGGFAVDEVRQRARWLEEAMGGRSSAVERSALVQETATGERAEAQLRAAVQRSGLHRAVIESTPFLLMGSVEQVVDKLERVRNDIGISHYVVRDPEGFAPVVDSLAGR